MREGERDCFSRLRFPHSRPWKRKKQKRERKEERGEKRKRQKGKVGGGGERKKGVLTQERREERQEERERGGGGGGGGVFALGIKCSRLEKCRLCCTSKERRTACNLSGKSQLLFYPTTTVCLYT